MTRLVPFLPLLLLGTSAACFAQLLPNYPPTEIGYVTRASSPTDFDVNGYHVVFNSKSEMFGKDAKDNVANVSSLNPFLGDRASVWGTLQKKSHTISVRQIVLNRADAHAVSGFALVQQVTPYASAPVPGAILVQADGYPILVSPKTAATFAPSLTSLADIHSNMWIAYHGHQQPSGIVIADKVGFQQNIVSDGEDRMRTKTEYDPGAVDPDAGEDPLKKFFLGADPKKIPPYVNEAMQTRINKIGASLIPKFQRDLPDTDPTKIHFRFQLVDEKKWYDAWTLPNGIILVPRQLVERLQNDSQIATVLADNIACALEKQSFRQLSTGHALTAAQIAGIAGGIFVPGLGAAASITTASVSSSMKRHAIEQSGRVSLYLMHEAGYDINEAPRTWWLLSSKKDIPEASLPERAGYLYQTLGTTWLSTIAATDTTLPTRAEEKPAP
jgi:hypothetical protein